MRNSVIVIIIGALIYTVLFIFVDQHVALWAKQLANTEWFTAGNMLSELANSYAYLTLITICLAGVAIYDYMHQQNKVSKNILYVLLTVSLAIIISDSLKYLLGRYRPIMFYQHGLYGFHYLASQWAMNSTPSGHATRIFALMCSLSFLFKKWSLIFILIAILVGVSRVIVHAHYPSDVLFGAVIGCLTAAWVYRYRR